MRRYVIIGNGFAGTTCAEQLRKIDAAASIIMFADEPYPLYNRIALPPMLRKQVSEAKVIIRDVAWHEKHTIDLRLSTRVDAIDHEGKTVDRGRQRVSLRRAAGGDRRPSEPVGVSGCGRRAQHLQLSVHERHEGDLRIARDREDRRIGRRLVHRVRTRRSVRLARRRDALADSRAALSAPHARRDLRRAARRSGARRRLHDPLRR